MHSNVLSVGFIRLSFFPPKTAIVTFLSFAFSLLAGSPLHLIYRHILCLFSLRVCLGSHAARPFWAEPCVRVCNSPMPLLSKSRRSSNELVRTPRNHSPAKQPSFTVWMRARARTHFHCDVLICGRCACNSYKYGVIFSRVLFMPMFVTPYNHAAQQIGNHLRGMNGGIFSEEEAGAGGGGSLVFGGIYLRTR